MVSFFSSKYFILLKAILIFEESNEIGCKVAVTSLLSIKTLDVNPILPSFFLFHKNELSALTGFT